MMRSLLVLAAAVPAVAQIPYGQLVIANRTGTASIPGLQLLDPGTGVVTPLYQPGASLAVGGSRTVTYDPLLPTRLYASSAISASISATVAVLQLTGNEFVRSSQNINLGSPGLPFHLRWAPNLGLLLLGRGGQLNRMYWRDIASVVHTQPTANLLPNNASDMTYLNGKAYATSEGDGSTVLNGTLIEWDLTANVDRVVGNTYPPLCSLTSYSGQLLAGDSTGTIWLIDPNSGNAGPFLVTGLGRINALAVDPSGIVFFVATNGTLGSVYSMANLSQPLFSTSSAIIEDLVAGLAPLPTVLTFGSGCAGSNAQVPTIVQGSMPGLGTTFTPQVRNALPGTGAFLVFGSSRLADAFGPLPRALDGLGMTGCTQYSGVVAQAFALASSTGNASVALPLPNQPALAGVHLPMQWLLSDPAANAFGATTSNGGEVFPR